MGVTKHPADALQGTKTAEPICIRQTAAFAWLGHPAIMPKFRQPAADLMYRRNKACSTAAPLLLPTRNHEEPLFLEWMMTIRKTLITVSALVLTISAQGVCADEASDLKAVLVTGASSGIGLKIAETLSSNGFYVYAGARKAEDLKRLDALENVSSVRLDVTVDEDIDAAVDFIAAQGRGLWGVVNNAGVAVFSPLLSGPESDIRFTFDVNVFGPFRINQAFLPMLVESKGRTSIIGSISGFLGSPADAGYAASKFAVEGYTDSLALELADTGVHVAIVEPGAYKSRIRDKYVAKALAADDGYGIDVETRQDLEEFAASNETMKEPDEVAQAVLHLMSSDAPKSRYMVTPNADQAAVTIRRAMQRLLELNGGQPYAYSRDELVTLLDELLEANQ